MRLTLNIGGKFGVLEQQHLSFNDRHFYLLNPKYTYYVQIVFVSHNFIIILKINIPVDENIK